MAIKEKDFIELTYTGRIKDDGFVFDTTDKAIAKENGLAGQGMEFGPVIVCIGEGQLLRGLDKQIVGKEPGKYTVDIQPEDGFGKKSASLIQLVSTSKFKKQNINPVPGLQVEVDGTTGTIKTVTGGRTLVDFNHPLASKELVYDIDIKKVITDPKEKADSFLKVSLKLKQPTVFENGELKVSMPQKFPEEIEKMISEKLTMIIPEIKKVSFEVAEKKETKKEAAADKVTKE